MKFGLFYEHQLPRPWTEGAEQRLFNESLEQIELADHVGFEHVWVVEHHFLEEYSHSSAPDVFLAAASQRTKAIRLGTGITIANPKINHPARVAERISTLDLVSNGRVEWGTGEGATLNELSGFDISVEAKAEMWREGVEHAASMMAMTPYPGHTGKYFTMPARNVIPKPVQSPHPPIWMACSRRESVLRAARHGMGALMFGFLRPEQAREWVQAYYDLIGSHQCAPLGHSVNPNIAVLLGLSVNEDEEVAVMRALDGFRFFGYAFGYHAVFGEHRPGFSDLWRQFEQSRKQIVDEAGRGAMGTPDQVHEQCRAYEEAGVDQIIFIQQAGRNQHDHICEAIEMFGRDVLPRFQASEQAHQKRKNAALAESIDAALRRKARMEPASRATTPVIRGIGASLRSWEHVSLPEPGRAVADPTRGGAIPFQAADPLKRIHEDL